MLDKTFGHLHRTDQIGLQDLAPVGVIGLPERRMRVADAGIVEEDVDRLTRKPMRQRLDPRMIGDVEFDQLDMAANGGRLPRHGGVQDRSRKRDIRRRHTAAQTRRPDRCRIP